MGVFVQAIPTLEGVTAEQFIKNQIRTFLEKDLLTFLSSTLIQKRFLKRKPKGILGNSTDLAIKRICCQNCTKTSTYFLSAMNLLRRKARKYGNV